jgi:hypothetical protein
VPRETIIKNNVKLFDFNLLSGPHHMHPLHFIVQANNIKALEKLRRLHRVEKIDFFARDGENLDLPQEFASPISLIYKYMVKTQKTILRKKYLD